MIRSLPPMIALLAAIGSAAPTRAAAEPDTAQAERADDDRVVAAPGGGDMVVLGPERKFVTRAHRDEAGEIVVQCVRDPPMPTGRE